jgi:feruloyl-CoA synthase
VSLATPAGERRTRAVSVAAPSTAWRPGADGSYHLASRHPLGPYPDRITRRLEHWAEHAGDRVFLAQRAGSGAWRTLGYAAALDAVRRLGQALLDRRLSAERPLVILSGNGIDHALLALAAMHVGVPYAPLATAYSLQAREYQALGQIMGRLEPGLVFAAEGREYERALAAVLPSGTELACSLSAPERIRSTPLAELAETSATPAVDDACARVGPDTLAKVLYTSGSTGRPKGVLNTQRMLCSNQAMLEAVFPFLAEEPPVLCDWLPWNHTAGGNHNFGIVLHHGGTLYIDEGRPLPGLFDATLRNLREVSATAHFTVPRTYEMLLPHLRADAALRERFFARLKLFFYAAAGLTQRVFDELSALAVATLGEELLWVTGMGATETAPFALSTGRAGARAGFIGFPVPGLELKLSPVGDKLEARMRGPNVTPGYWKDAALTRTAFDAEGYYRLGDAMRFAVPEDPAQGLLFDGRLAEDFKLSTGTWVHVGELRARILAHGGGYVHDAVIAGHDRGFVAALLFPNLAPCRALCPELANATARELVDDPRVARRFREVLEAVAAESTGSSTRVVRAVVLDQPPSLDARELTDKGSVSQKAVLETRAAWVERLYASPPSASVIQLEAVHD